MTSPGSSTTQMSSASRRASWQMRQRSSSARLKHTWHRPMRSLTSRMASASAVASSTSARRMWNARRWAVRWPIPGSLPSSVIRRWTGGAYKRARGSEAGQAQRAEVHAAREPAELALLELLGGAQRLVHRGQHHVLQQFGVVRVDRVGGDRDRLDDEVARHLDLDHAAAGGGLDLLVLELLLRLHHVLLHLLDLAHHLLHVRGLGHQASPSLLGSGSGTISSASNSVTKRATISSSEGGACGAASSAGPRSRSSYWTRSDVPVRPRTAFSTTSRCSAVSAIRRLKLSAGANATTSSWSRSSTGRASDSAAPTSWLSAHTASRTAGHRPASPSSVGAGAGGADAAARTGGS